MFCPRCAVQNLDDAKFCRGCGIGLESLALALSGKYHPAKDDDEKLGTWLDQRRRGINKLVRATGLLGSSLLIGAALGLFSNAHDWIFVWMVFCGWMATWGILSLVSGVHSLIESRYMKADLEAARATNHLWTSAQPQQFSGVTSLPALPPQSVTEHTTRTLVKEPNNTKEI